MSRKIVFVIVVLVGMSMVSPASGAVRLALGKPAPPFLVKSGDNKKLTLNEVLGKVVVVFYEARKSVDKNNELRNELVRLYREQPESIKEEIFRLVVIDCSKAHFPAVSIWKHKLAEHSRLASLTIYGDWDRQMLRDYCLQKNDSNFLIIDQNGIVRYSAAGKIGNGQFKEIKDLLASLIQAD
jgi:alkyl hydroperoxide reductase subunit AhpC